MDLLTGVLAAAAIVLLLAIGVIGSGLWIGWWRQRRWPRERR